MTNTMDNIIGFDAQAYSQRVKGYSPEPIRDALWKLVSQELEGDVLDAGSGEGGWIKRLKGSKNIRRIISVDIIDDGASQIDGVEFHLIDISQSSLPCRDRELDCIFAIEVLEHLANPRNFVKEASRGLKKGGKLVITTPCNDSLRAKLSFLFRGYFPAFCEHDYYASGHITPILEIDLKRMACEAGFDAVDFFYPLTGRIPKTNIEWQRIHPLLQGKLWSDALIAILVK
ncbi:MAG TPA: class I SAM-dependent methyltransferase [Candidatus Sericytochromatia bacterium]